MSKQKWIIINNNRNTSSRLDKLTVISDIAKVSRVASRSRKRGGRRWTEDFGMLTVVHPEFEYVTVASISTIKMINKQYNKSNI